MGIRDESKNFYLLDFIATTFQKMFYGIWLFLFKELPQSFFLLLIRFWPRFIVFCFCIFRIALWGSLWCLLFLACPILVLLCANSGFVNFSMGSLTIGSAGIFMPLAEHMNIFPVEIDWFLLISSVWMSCCIVGSFYGIRHILRQRRTLYAEPEEEELNFNPPKSKKKFWGRFLYFLGYQP